MKVSELIEALKIMPQDAEVRHLWDGEARTAIELVWLARDGNVITADHGMGCYSANTMPVDATLQPGERYWETPRAGEEE